MLNQKEATEKITIMYGDIKRIYKFKYFGEMIQANVTEKESHKQKNQKMTNAVIKPETYYQNPVHIRNTGHK